MFRFEDRRVGGKTVCSQQCGFKPGRRRVTAVRALHHRTGVRRQTGTTRRRHTQRVGELRRIEFEQMGGSHRRTHRPHHAGRMKGQGAARRFRRSEDAPLNFETLGAGGYHLTAIAALRLGQRQRHWYHRRHRMRRRARHRLEIEHMHGHRIGIGGGTRRHLAAKTPECRFGSAARVARVRRVDLRCIFGGAGDCHCHAIENQAFNGGDCIAIESVVILGAGNSRECCRLAGRGILTCAHNFSN